MNKINENPDRYVLEKTVTERVLFKKKEFVRYALGDDNQNPLTEYSFKEIEDFDGGYSLAHPAKGKTQVIDLNGVQMFPELTNKYKFSILGDYFMIESMIGNKGLVSKEGKILIEPHKSDTFIHVDDYIIYGYNAGNIPNYNKFGLAYIGEDGFKKLLDCDYNYLEYLGNGFFAVGRYHVTKEREIASLTKDRVTTTVQYAAAIYSAEKALASPNRKIVLTKGLVSDKVFGPLNKTDGGYFTVYFPHVKPIELSHMQTSSEAFTGDGLMDLKDAKKVKLNENFEML